MIATVALVTLFGGLAHAGPDGAKKGRTPEPTKAASVPATADDCLDDLPQREVEGLMGRLSPANAACLEVALTAATGAAKARLSSTLIANAWARNDKPGWEALAVRHAREIDPNDPTIPYQLAIHLSQFGPTHADEVVAFASQAMSKSSAWTDDLQVKRVFSLRKATAAARLAQWQQVSRAPNEPTARTSALNAAEEWAHYADNHQLDAKDADKICLLLTQRNCRQ